VLTAFGGTCPESTLPEVQALKSRPPLNARQAGKRGSYLPDFWKGHWRRLRVRLPADADHSAGLYGRYQESPRLFMKVLLTEAQMHFGSALLAIWPVIGGIAAAQRGDYTHHIDCSRAGTIGVTILAGPLHYAGVDPQINCSTP
jgi:hypothetical protein